MRELNADAFHRLLATLDPDPESAAEKYEALLRRLVIFFEGRSCAHESEILADRTLDVVAEKLAAGSELYAAGGLPAFCYGVARNVWRDWLKQPRPIALTIDPSAPTDADPRQEARLHCLEKSLTRLAPESRKLILEFYEGERRMKIENRQRLADLLKITPNALRRRTHVIRVNLETWVKECMEKA